MHQAQADMLFDEGSAQLAYSFFTGNPPQVSNHFWFPVFYSRFVVARPWDCIADDARWNSIEPHSMLPMFIQKELTD